MITVLVSGAGGGVGQGIIKSLRLINDLEVRIVGADMAAQSAGLYAADVSVLLPSCNAENYIEELGRVFESESVNFYFPGTDAELKVCASNKLYIFEKYGVHTVVSSLETVKLADSKYDTAMYLKENGFNYPETFWLEDVSPQALGYPIILKPDIGCRSVGVFKVDNKEQLDQHLKNPKGLIVQELVGTSDTEFTCTLVKVNGNISPVLPLRRNLRAGDTYRAVPEKNSVIEEYVSSVASMLDIDGACNFQLRLDENNQPKIFEINSRYSGTTPFCSQLGFNPVEYYIKKHMEIDYRPKIDFNSVVLRYWSELVVSKEQLKVLKSERRTTPRIEPQFNLF